MDPLSYGEVQLLDTKHKEFVTPVPVAGTKPDSQVVRNEDKAETITLSDSELPSQPEGDIEELEDDPRPPLPLEDDGLFEMILEQHQTSGESTAKSNQSNSNRSRDRHKKAHTCKLCNKVFFRRYHLTDHMRSHTNERPFSCDVCEKAFSRKSYLRMHLRLHNGQLPYSCRICSQSFNMKSQLEAHLYMHAGEGPFNCEVCDELCKDRATLRSHRQVHETRNSSAS